MRIVIEGMTGLQPKVASSLLKDNQATQAINVRAEKGEVHSWSEGNAVASLSASSYKTLARYFDGTTSHWVTSTNVLDFVLSPIANDTYRRMFFTGEAEPRAFANDIVSVPFNPATDYYKIGHAPPAAAITTPSGYTTGSAYRAWIYTYVNRYGEETGPSPVKSITDYGSGTVTLTGYSTPTAGFGIKEAAVGGRKGKIRLYRTNVSGTGAAFQFVKDTEVDNTTNFTTLAINDDVADANLGSVCLVTAYDIGIPSGITGLVAMSNGSLSGFVGNTVYFSEVYLPGSWSNSFKMSFQYDVIGLAPFGSMLFVLTKGLIYVITGSDPSNLSRDKFEGFFPCVSKRGIASGPWGVAFPSYEGLIVVNQNGPRNITFDLLTEQDWNVYQPAYLHGEIWGGKYFGFYYASAAVFGGFVFDIANGILTDLLDYHLAAYLSEGEGKFYTIINDQIREWGADPYNYMYYTWKSKTFVLPQRTQFTCAKVYLNIPFYTDLVGQIEDTEYLEDLNETIFAGGDLDECFNENTVEFNVEELNGSAMYDLNSLSVSAYVSFKLYADSVLKMTKVLNSQRPFRLVSGFKANTIEVEISAYMPVRKIVLADSFQEL